MKNGRAKEISSRTGLAVTGTAKTGALAIAQSQKAAIIVQYLLSEGAELPLAELPREMQFELTHRMAQISMIDQGTLSMVVDEFAQALGAVGVTGGGTMEAALATLTQTLPQERIEELRRETETQGESEIWARVSGLEPVEICAMVDSEAIEIAAVILSKIDVPKAAQVLKELPFARAKAICQAVSSTENIAPQIVSRIAATLVEQLDARPRRAFDALPEDRVGAILNIASSDLRDQMLASLADEDEGFADRIKRTIFVFGDIPTRIVAREIPILMRFVPPQAMGQALAYANKGQAVEAVEYILKSLPKRLAEQLREQMDLAENIEAEAGEAAMADVVVRILTAANAGEITLLAKELP